MYITISKHQLNNYTNSEKRERERERESERKENNNYGDIIEVAMMFLSLQIVKEIEEFRK